MRLTRLAHSIALSAITINHHYHNQNCRDQNCRDHNYHNHNCHSKVHIYAMVVVSVSSRRMQQRVGGRPAKSSARLPRARSGQLDCMLAFGLADGLQGKSPDVGR